MSRTSETALASAAPRPDDASGDVIDPGGTLPASARIGRYEIVRPIGAGGVGVV
ncbi:MAG: hypothetical protein HOO96_11180, partial [Polyangiaceae bacterium]|nr:hypothetical protein [Polyangiaceae bacterium]